MGALSRMLASLVTPAVLMVGCSLAPPSSTTSSAPAGREAPRRLVAAIQGDPHTVYGALNPSSNIPGIEALEQLLNGSLSETDGRRIKHPVLAEAVPSLENGLWTVSSDGRMQTRWVIRPNVFWHDGTPFTSTDVLFRARLGQDKELAIFSSSVYDRVEAFETPDSRTVLIKWKAPYIKADTAFGYPVARHLLEQPYQEDKASLTQHPYFSRDFVGTGSYRLKEWVAGSHMVIEANDQFVLGRPRIDQIEVRFIPDQSTLVANVLAGTVQVVMGRGISLEQAQQVVGQWREGKMDLEFTNFLALYPQFLNPSPQIVANLQFRRALLHALDRQQMADELQGGLVPLAHSLVSPNEGSYPAIEPSIVKYDYDPRRALEMIQALGYSRGADGMLQDATGQKLSIQLRTSATRDVSEKALLAAATTWQQLGVSTDIYVTPPQLARDREFRAVYPGFELAQQPNDIDSLDRYRSTEMPLAENNFVKTGNRARYNSPDLDAMIDRYVVTIAQQERVAVVSQIVRHLTENVVHLSLFYGVEPVLFTSRLQGVSGRDTWDAFRWQLS